MTGPATDLVIGAALGVSLAMPPGPMNAWIAAVAARSYRAGVLTGLGAMTADAILGALVFALDRSVDLSAAVRLIYLPGAAVMLFLGVRLLRRPASAPPSPPPGGAYARAVLLGLSNPFQVLWWLTAGVAFAYLGGAVLFVGLFGAIALWVVGFPAAIQAGARRWPSFENAVRLASGAVLVGFAAYFVLLFVLG